MGSKYQGSHAKKLKHKVRPITMIFSLLLLTVIGFSGFKLYEGFEQYWNDYNKDLEIQDDVEREDKAVNWNKLLKINKDVIGWLYCPNSKIDYPVVKAHDNTTYLTTGVDKKWSVSGTLFTDCNTKEPLQDANTVIYGHHMRDSSMFHDLDKWQESDYFKKHNTFYFYTPMQNYELQILACENVSATDLTVYGVPFTSDEEKTDFIEQVIKDSRIKSKVQYTDDDIYVTLSTCAYTFKNARSIIVCKVVKTEQRIEQIEAKKPPRDKKITVFFQMIREIIREGYIQ